MSAFSRRMTAMGHRAANAIPGLGAPDGRPLFITGNGRSGTSWIGEALGYGPGKLYYREPCHPNRNGLPTAQADAVWSRFVPADSEDAFFIKTLDKAFAGQWWGQSGLAPGALKTRVFDNPRIIIKEVAAFLSLEWVSARWAPDVLMIIRHPGAYVASVNNLDQQTEEISRFEILRDNPVLQKNYLAPFASHLNSLTHPAEITAASWAIRNYIVLKKQQAHQDWALVRYEDVAADPLAQFEALYKRFNLEWNETIASWIKDKSTSESAGQFTTSRNSASRINAWKNKLSAEQIDQIRNAVAPFALSFYEAEEDWTPAD